MTHAERQVYSSIDVAKLVCALAVVVIHTQPLKGLWDAGNFFLVQGLARLAVPFFFVASGYFFAKGLKGDAAGAVSRLKKSLVRLFIPYLLWTLIYSPLDLPRRIGPDLVSTAEGLLRYVVAFFTIGSHMQFWYFPALALALILLVLCYARWKWGPIFTLGLGLYLFGCLGDSYYQLSRAPLIGSVVDLWESVFVTTRNLLTMSFLPVAAGAWLASREKPIRSTSSWVVFAVLVPLTLCESWMTETLGLAKDHNGGLFVVPAALALFSALLSVPGPGAERGRDLRDASVIIFCCHLLVTGVSGFIDLLGPAGGVLGILGAATGGPWPRWAQFLFTTGFSLGLSALILGFRSRWTKGLY